MHRLRLVPAVLVTVLAANAVHAAPPRPLGDSRVVAQLPPAPGYPEGIAVRDGVVYVATAARFGTAVVPPLDEPEVQAFDAKTGELAGRWVVRDKDPNADHGLSGLAFDAAGRLYALDTQWGIVRFDPATTPPVLDLNDAGQRAAYLYASAFPDLLPCAVAPAGTDCSPGLSNAPSLPNDLAFDAAGNAYVSDSLQATVWLVRPPAGPGTPSEPEPWLQDDRLTGGFGPNGIRFDKRGVLHLVVSADSLGRGHVYRIGADRSLTAVHTYLLGEVPDNMAFGRTGRLYVALAGSNQIQVLDAGGTELARYGGPARRAGGGTVAYDMPSGVTLDSSRGAVLVNNHSEVLGIPDRFVVFDVYVDDRGEPLVEPVLP